MDDVTGLRKQVADLKQSQVERRRVEEGLRKSEEELRTLLDSAPVGVCLFSPEGEPLLANRRMAALLGYDTPQELVRLGGSFGVVADESGRSWLRDRASDPTPARNTLSFRCRDGEMVTLSVLGEPHEGGSKIAVAVVPPG